MTSNELSLPNPVMSELHDMWTQKQNLQLNYLVNLQKKKKKSVCWSCTDFCSFMQPAILPVQMIRIGQLVILCVPGGIFPTPRP